MPNIFAYPSWKTVLHFSFTKEGAEKFVEGYENPFLKPFLYIETAHVNVTETD
jgi:hypothetical protein